MPLEWDIRLPKNRLEAFDLLYNQGYLGEYETRSGRGSTLFNTRKLRSGLQHFFNQHVIGTIVDIGCGDCNWLTCINLAGINYRGTDIVHSLIEKNTYELTQPNIHFALEDILTTIPQKSDLVLCRDLFSHFPVKDVAIAFNHIKQSGSTYLAASSLTPILMSKLKTAASNNLNNNSTAGYWRAVNLRQFPFLFRDPLLSIQENQPGKTLDIWRLEDLPLLDIQAVTNGEVDNPTVAEDFSKYKFFNALCALPFIHKIELHGSRSVNEHQSDSDIDLLLHCADTMSKEEWLKVCDIAHNADINLKVECAFYADNGFDKTLNSHRRTLLYDRSRSS